MTWFLFIKTDQKISIYSSISQKKKEIKKNYGGTLRPVSAHIYHWVPWDTMEAILLL